MPGVALGEEPSVQEPLLSFQNDKAWAQALVLQMLVALSQDVWVAVGALVALQLLSLLPNEP